MQPCSTKGCQTMGGQKCRSEKKSSSKSQSTQKRGYRGQVRPFLFQNSSFDLHSFAALWATRLHSTSFKRSDSYLFGNILKIGMTALFRYFICAKRCYIYLILCGHRANQTALAFFRILERSRPLTSIFCFESADIYWVYLLCKKLEPF